MEEGDLQSKGSEIYRNLLIRERIRSPWRKMRLEHNQNENVGREELLRGFRRSVVSGTRTVRKKGQVSSVLVADLVW